MADETTPTKEQREKELEAASAAVGTTKATLEAATAAAAAARSDASIDEDAFDKLILAKHTAKKAHGIALANEIVAKRRVTLFAIEANSVARLALTSDLSTVQRDCLNGVHSKAELDKLVETVKRLATMSPSVRQTLVGYGGTSLSYTSGDLADAGAEAVMACHTPSIGKMRAPRGAGAGNGGRKLYAGQYTSSEYAHLYGDAEAVAKIDAAIADPNRSASFTHMANAIAAKRGEPITDKP